LTHIQQVDATDLRGLAATSDWIRFHFKIMSLGITASIFASPCDIPFMLRLAAALPNSARQAEPIFIGSHHNQDTDVQARW